tara:strand:- start:3549 stop:4742 length:1194 start_codon:yes stop_codon:yes gene_type:complete
MHTNIIKKINIVFGQLNFKIGPGKIFDNTVIDFLDELSKAILKNKKNFSYTDLITFAFWCRKANLIKLSENYDKRFFMFGRGTVLHIAPSNVPMNFSYSLVFGLLSGNNNIVRLPSRNFIQVKLLCKVISKILKKSKFLKIKKKICFIKYKKSDQISSELSKIVDARLIWGGDETINQFKSYYTLPRCVDLTFSNRYSISLIDIDQIAKIDTIKLKNLVKRFFNDAYLMDQQGCSSPQAVIWLGKDKKNIKDVFWNMLIDIVNKKYDDDLSITNNKISSLSSAAINTKLKFKTKYKNFKLIKIDVSKPSIEIEKLQCHFGTFVEINIQKLDEIKKIITKKFQTITTYGVDHKKLEKFIIKYGVAGIDRIVPIGGAFDMGPIWDGYDIIYSLSRIVSK